MSNRIAFFAVLAVVVILVLWRYYPRTRFEFVPNDVQATIPEGKNIADIDRILFKAKIAENGALLKPEYIALEGMLFPDTYRFDRGSSAEDIIARMRKDYSQKDALIIASILEKEVRTENDMKIVAGIIEKRLAAGMALQIDATVAYGVCYPEFLKGRYCDVSKVNLVDNKKLDSAYNTYTRTGLPVGPISNPGLKALMAAQNPQSSEYWYYLSAKDGTTIFSRTLEEHNIARVKYLK